MQAVTSWLERRLKLKVKCVQEHSGETVGVEVPWLRHDVAQEAEAEDSATKPPAYRRENPQDAGVGTWQKLETSVVSHADRLLFRTALARVTFSRMSVAFAVQMKGLGF
jgi:hypothetical protein